MLYRILAIGDVVGEPGLKHLERHLRSLKRLKDVHFTVVNGWGSSPIRWRPSTPPGLMW